MFRKIFNKVIFSLVIILPILIIIKGDAIYSGFKERIESLNFTDTKSVNAISNKSRFGIQYANFQVFKDNPIVGVGWGQQSFESKNLYPKWATNNNYEFKTVYLNEKVKSFPPGYNFYLRLLAETGIIGFILFSIFLLLIFYYTYKVLVSKSEHKYIGITVFIVFFGSVLIWFQIDSLRQYLFWFTVAMLICLKTHEEKRI